MIESQVVAEVEGVHVIEVMGCDDRGVPSAIAPFHNFGSCKHNIANKGKTMVRFRLYKIWNSFA